MDKSGLKRFYVCADNYVNATRYIWFKLGDDYYVAAHTAVNWRYSIPIPGLRSQDLLSPCNRKKLIPSDHDRYYMYRLWYVLRKFDLVPEDMYLTF